MKIWKDRGIVLFFCLLGHALLNKKGNNEIRPCNIIYLSMAFINMIKQDLIPGSTWEPGYRLGAQLLAHNLYTLSTPIVNKVTAVYYQHGYPS
jgi:hypothetical protein